MRASYTPTKEFYLEKRGTGKHGVYDYCSRCCAEEDESQEQENNGELQLRG